MRYKPEHKLKVRAFILDTAGRCLRKAGFDGVGVHSLMEEAGLTTGAFYSHFNSKDELIIEVLKKGLEGIVERMDARIASEDSVWLNAVLEKYFGTKHCRDVGDGCILPALTVDASRAGPDSRELYNTMIVKIIDRIRMGLSDPGHPDARKKAWTVLSIMVGAVTIARALPAGEVQRELLVSVLETSKELR